MSCKHPDDKVLTIAGKHDPWQGTCQECGAEVTLVPEPVPRAEKE